MRGSVLAIIIVVLSHFSYSQSIKGTIVDSENNPIEYASIRAMRPSDSSVVSGAYSDIDGNFIIDNIAQATYLVRITYSSLETVDQLVDLGKSKNTDLGTVQMKLDQTINLDEVVAAGSLDVLKAGIDKKVYSVEDDLTSKGGSVNDILNNIPSITVDQDGNISLRGDGNVTILIDGRPSTLAANDGQSLLNSLPANSIERIEVVTNPSARYDPDGTSGIINIVLKKNKLKGFNGMVSATAATEDLYQGNFGVSYRNKRINLNFNYSLDYYEGYRNFESELERGIVGDSTSRLVQSRGGDDLRSSHTILIGSDFYINDRNVIGISATANTGRRERQGDLENRLYDSNGDLERRWNRSSFDPRKNSNLDFNLNYLRTFKDAKGEWSFNANQSFERSNEQGFYDEEYLNLDDTPLGWEDLNQRLDNNSTERITTVQTDVSYIMERIRARFETGAKAIVRSDFTSTYSESRDTISDSFLEDTLANFDYSYNESVYSVYGVFGQELGKFKYQVGIRGEYAEQVPNLISSDKKITNSYFNLFPSVHLKYDASKISQFSLSYSKRINRARSGQLNPFTSYADPFNLRTGNPELQPEYIHSFDLGYSYTGKKLIFSTSVFHRITNDVINRVRIFYPNNTAVVTFDNIDKSESTGFELITIYKPFKWMKNTFSVNGNYIDYTNNDPTTDWNNDGFNWGAKYIMSVDFWKNSATFQLNGNYYARRITPQGVIKPRGSLNLAVDKRLLKKKTLSVGMRITDVFNTQMFEMELDQLDARQDMTYKWLTRRFYVSISYKFGNLDQKEKATRLPSGDDGGGE